MYIRNDARIQADVNEKPESARINAKATDGLGKNQAEAKICERTKNEKRLERTTNGNQC